jgi:hypothetical protein
VGHHHHHGHAHGESDSRRLAIALALIVGFMCVEVVVGILADSLALLSDAAHMLTDAGAIALALFAAGLAFGYMVVLPRALTFLTEYDDAWTHNAYARRQWGLVADVQAWVDDRLPRFDAAIRQFELGWVGVAETRAAQLVLV